MFIDYSIQPGLLFVLDHFDNENYAIRHYAESFESYLFHFRYVASLFGLYLNQVTTAYAILLRTG